MKGMVKKLVYLNSGEILNKLKSKSLASSPSTYNLSTLYTTLPYNLIKEKITELIEKKLLIESAHFIWLVIRTVPF